MQLNFDNPNRGLRDCPKCQHTMQHLREYNAIERNEGILLETGLESRPFAALLSWFGW